MHVAPEPGRHATRDDSKSAAQRVALLGRLIDRRDHLLRCLGVRAAHGRALDVVLGEDVWVAAFEADVHGADRLREADHVDAEVAEQLAGDATRGDPGRRLSRRRALEHVADVCVAVLERPGEVGVPRPQPGHDLRLVAFFRRCHLAGPVDVVLVLEDQRDGAADRVAAAHAADDPGDVGLDLLTSATAVTALPAGKVAAKVLLGDLETCRQTFDHNRELGSMRLPRGQKSEH